MDCQKIKDLFSEYIDHQLDNNQLKLFENHMEECQECREEFYKFEKMLIKIKSMKSVEPSSELKAKIISKVVYEENKRLNTKIINLKKYTYIVAVIVIVFGTVLYKYSLKRLPLIEREYDTTTNPKNKLRNFSYDDQDFYSNNSDEVQDDYNFDHLYQDIFNEKLFVDLDLYNEGIELNIVTNDIEQFKNFLTELTQYVKFYDNQHNYVEIVMNEDEFYDMEYKIENIQGCHVYLNGIDNIKSEIKNIIENGHITKNGLIKFKMNILQEN